MSAADPWWCSTTGDVPKVPCHCACHRPIPASFLRRRLLRLYLTEIVRREHRDHFMFEVGCPACAAGAPRFLALADEEGDRGTHGGTSPGLAAPEAT